MQITLKKYVSDDTYMAPSGALMDAAAVRAKFPASAHFAHVVQTDAAGQMMYGFYNLAAMRSKYGIDSSLSEDEAVPALEAAMNAEQDAQAAAATEPTAEERIAAMMEYQVLTSMSDV